MKRGLSPNGFETFSFGAENNLKIFPPNTYKFKPKDHIVLDEVQECILDNFWFQYNNKREDKGYMLAILNSLAEYFHMINGKIQSKELFVNIEKKPLYVIYRGRMPGVYITYESVITQQIEREKDGGISWKRYVDIDQALLYARNILGINYFIEPAAKEYIQKYKKANEMKMNLLRANIQEDGPSKIPTYKDVVKNISEISNDDIEKRIREKLDLIVPQLKKDIKEEVMREVKHEIQQNMESIKNDYEENIKKDYDLKMNVPVSDDDMLDIGGHGQKPEY